MNIALEAAKIANACQKHYSDISLSQSAIDAIVEIIKNDLIRDDNGNVIFGIEYLKSKEDYEKYVRSEG